MRKLTFLLQYLWRLASYGIRRRLHWQTNKHNF